MKLFIAALKLTAVYQEGCQETKKDNVTTFQTFRSKSDNMFLNLSFT